MRWIEVDEMILGEWHYMLWVVTSFSEQLPQLTHHVTSPLLHLHPVAKDRLVNSQFLTLATFPFSSNV